MNISEHNRRVAISRWSKIHNREKILIPNSREALLVKASVCGFLAGDGSLQKRKEKSFYHYQVDFFPDDILMMQTYINQIKYLYNKTPAIRKKYKFYTVRIGSKTIYEDVTNLANFGIKKWTLPNSLFDIKNAKENWLKAFFSAEGYVNKSSIKLQTVNINGMKAVLRLLDELGIKANYYEYAPKKEKESAVGIIMIHRKDSRKTFYEKVGFWHSKKTELLKKSLGL